MSTPIITVENLGKTYRLEHQVQRRRYTALRDVIAETAKRLIRAPFSRNGSRESSGRTEEFWALEDVSFEVKRGEVVGIIGRNGAGKSTLLKLLSRITEPTTGRVRLRGRVASLLEVGTGFHPELTGRENIYLNGAILGMPRAEIRRKFDEIVAFAEVEKFLDTPVKRYSSGMYVRLAFAVAAHLEPEILVVDEVLAVGDAEFQKKCLGKMQDVSKGGRTVLFVSHNMAAVQSLCGTGLLLDSGRLGRIGPINSVVAEYNAKLRGSSVASRTALLGPALAVQDVECRPLVIESGDPITVSFKLSPQESTTVRELALLIYSDCGVRVSILDLRREGLRDLHLCGHPVQVEVSLDSFPLVEGDYRLGFYVVTENYGGNYLDVASFSVSAARQSSDVVPYARQHRGFIELAFAVKKDAAELISL
jgi:lipopolysaccharide transport system ATP-binding protein